MAAALCGKGALFLFLSYESMRLKTSQPDLLHHFCQLLPRAPSSSHLSDHSACRRSWVGRSPFLLSNYARPAMINSVEQPCLRSSSLGSSSKRNRRTVRFGQCLRWLRSNACGSAHRRKHDKSNSRCTFR
jgi:hypothetical protein